MVNEVIKVYVRGSKFCATYIITEQQNGVFEVFTPEETRVTGKLRGKILASFLGASNNIFFI